MISIELFEPFLGTAFGYFEKLAILGEKTLVVDLSPLDPTLMVAGEAIAAPLAIVKFMALIFLAFPMAAVMKMLPGRNLKHLFSTAGGFFMLQWLFGADWIHAMVSCTVTYLICAVVRGRSMPVIAFVWVMGYMTVSHAYRMYVSYHSGIFDYTGTQMVLTMKLTSFAYNLYDGTIDKKKVLETEHTDKRLARVYSDRKKYAITKLPNILEFFGYAFCFTCLMAGPAFEYRDYINIIDGTAYKRKTKDGKVEEVVPSAFLPAIKNLIISVVCLGTHLFLSGYVSSSQLFRADWIAVTPWFKRVPYFWLTELMERNKYYFVWKAAEGASVLAGFGFEGYDSNGSVIGWGGVGNVDILEVEFAPNLQSMVRSWNKRTQGWLERYTYCRLGNSLVATYFVSALWHGLYPGYFMFFLSVPILTSIERLVRVKINPRVIPGYDGRDNATAPKSIVTTIYWGLCMVGTSLGLNYIAQVFAQQTQTGERALAIWGSYYHIPHLVFVAIYLLLSALPTPRSKDADEKKKK